MIVSSSESAHARVHHPAKHSGSKPPHRIHLRGALTPLIVGLLIGPIFAAVYLAAFHAPQPHELPIGIVGSNEVLAQARAQSDRHGDAFQIHPYRDGSTAAAAVQDHVVDGALVVSDRGPRLLVAGANGAAVTQTLQSAFAPIAAAMHASLPVTDLKPLPAGDTRGLSVFYAAFGIVLGAFLFGITIMGVGRQLPHGWRAASTIAFGALTALVVAWLLGPGFGALPAPFPLSAALIAMLGLAIATATMALLRVFGATGTFVASIVLLTLGNATSTGILPPQYLPSWLEPLAGVLPVGVAVRALRGAAYFNDDGVVPAFIVLAIWVFVAAGVFTVAHEVSARRRNGRQRRDRIDVVAPEAA